MAKVIRPIIYITNPETYFKEFNTRYGISYYCKRYKIYSY